MGQDRYRATAAAFGVCCTSQQGRLLSEMARSGDRLVVADIR